MACVNILCIIKWLTPRVDRMNQILCCDWPLDWSRWSYFARSGPPATSRKTNFTESHICNKSFIDQVCSVKMAGYCPRSFFASLWTSTPSINTQKKNLANIQPSWPRTWSITQTYRIKQLVMTPLRVENSHSWRPQIPLRTLSFSFVDTSPICKQPMLWTYSGLRDNPLVIKIPNR